MTKKSFLKIGGAMLLLALVLNIQYAWGGDGVKDHPLHLEVLAQSNDSISTGGDAGKGAGTDTGVLWTEISEDCFVIVTGAADTVTLSPAPPFQHAATLACSASDKEQTEAKQATAFLLVLVEFNRS